MPSLIAASATRQPILPRPTMPSVWPRQLDAGECLLAVLDRLVEVGVVAASSAVDEAQRRREVARRHQHAGEHQLLDRVGVGARRVEHRHAALRSSPRPGCCWCRRRRGRSPARWPGSSMRVQVGRAHQDRVGLGDVLADRVALGAAGACRPVRRDLVQHQDARTAGSAMARLELLHVGDQRLHALDRHRVVDRRAHAADRRGGP